MPTPGSGTGSPWDPFGYEMFTAPAARAPGYESYKPVTAEELNQDPSYQFRQREQQKAIERSAAAGGTLLTGGTLKDISRFGSDLASTEYANVDARKFRNWQTGYGRLASEDENAYTRGLTGWSTNYNRLRGEESDLYGRALGGESTQYGRARDEFNLARDIFEKNRDQAYQKYLELAKLGRY